MSSPLVRDMTELMPDYHVTEKGEVRCITYSDDGCRNEVEKFNSENVLENIFH